MNVFLWIVQVALALLAFAGGTYKVFFFDQVKDMSFYGALPRAGWGALGVLEMACGILLVAPAGTKWMPVVSPAAAGVLALESLVLAGLYAGYSVELTSANPLIWVIVMALLALVVACGRYALQPRP